MLDLRVEIFVVYAVGNRDYDSRSGVPVGQVLNTC
jgi:hypothetical protein